MSDKICFTSPQTKSDLNKLGSILLQHYNKNIETTLNEHDESLWFNVKSTINYLITNYPKTHYRMRAIFI